MTQPQEQQRTPPEPPKPAKAIANAGEFRKRLVPLQHNGGQPIVKAKIDRDDAHALTRALKKLRRNGKPQYVELSNGQKLRLDPAPILTER